MKIDENPTLADDSTALPDAPDTGDTVRVAEAQAVAVAEAQDEAAAVAVDVTDADEAAALAIAASDAQARASAAEATALGPSSQSTRMATPALSADRRIGELLVSAGCLTEAQVQELLEAQRGTRRPFGELAIASGATTRSRVVWALSQQFNYAYADASVRSTIRRELVMAHSPFSDEVECFRSLRSELAMGVLSGVDGPKPALAVVSANVGDGKSFVLSNLAVAFGQARGRTLIVDADMRSPRIHRLFGVSGAFGLSNLLSGRSQPQVLQPVKFLPNLFVMPAGPVPPNPTELLHQPTFELMLQELATKFDAVLVDTPAATHGSDAELIASRAGAALVIARRDATEAAGVGKLLQRLKKRSVSVAGVMMNVV